MAMRRVRYAGDKLRRRGDAGGHRERSTKAGRESRRIDARSSALDGHLVAAASSAGGFSSCAERGRSRRRCRAIVHLHLCGNATFFAQPAVRNTCGKSVGGAGNDLQASLRDVTRAGACNPRLSVAGRLPYLRSRGILRTLSDETVAEQPADGYPRSINRRDHRREVCVQLEHSADCFISTASAFTTDTLAPPLNTSPSLCWPSAASPQRPGVPTRLGVLRTVPATTLPSSPSPFPPLPRPPPHRATESARLPPPPFLRPRPPPRAPPVPPVPTPSSRSRSLFEAAGDVRAERKAAAPPSRLGRAPEEVAQGQTGVGGERHGSGAGGVVGGGGAGPGGAGGAGGSPPPPPPPSSSRSVEPIPPRAHRRARQ